MLITRKAKWYCCETEKKRVREISRQSVAAEIKKIPVKKRIFIFGKSRQDSNPEYIIGGQKVQIIIMYSEPFYFRKPKGFISAFRNSFAPVNVFNAIPLPPFSAAVNCAR